MPDFLNRLAARALGVAPVAQPLVPAMFSPAFAETTKPVPRSSAELSQSPTALFSRDGIAPAEAELQLARQAPLAPSDSSAAWPRDLGTSATPPQPWRHDPPLSTLPLPSPGESHSERAADEGISSPQMAPVRPNKEEVAERLMIAAHPSGEETIRPRALLFSSVTFGNVGGVQPLRPGDAVTPVPEAPVIRVTIGRVDVRAELPAAASRPAPRRAQASALSLEEYAKQRREGLR